MKYILSAIAMFFICVSANAQTCKSSGEQTSDAAILSEHGYICGLLVITDGTNDAKVVIYDNTAGSGTVKWEQTVIGGDNYGGRAWARPVEFNIGIYVDVTGTGASYIVEYTTTDK